MNDKRKILVVDDEPMALEMVRYVIEKEGFESLEAPNGRVGLELAIKHVPALLITDLMMPEMDGFQLVQAVRSTDPVKHVPILVCTARPEDEVGEKCTRLGANGFIGKPIDFNELRKKIKEFSDGATKIP